MDDQNFDQKTALDWINVIEKPGKSWRDDHVYCKLNGLIENSLPKTILDIGCGQRICSVNLELSRCKYTGIEPSPYLLDRAKQLYTSGNKTFRSGNAYDLPVPNQSFDCAFSILVWHLLKDLQTASYELARVLSENGRFLIVTANPGAYPAWKDFYYDLKLTGKKLEGTMQLGEALSHDVLYLHTFDELRDSLKISGLEIENIETFLPANDPNESKLLISIQGRKCMPDQSRRQRT